jgi:hypothetical protein
LRADEKRTKLEQHRTRDAAMKLALSTRLTTGVLLPCHVVVPADPHDAEWVLIEALSTEPSP